MPVRVRLSDMLDSTARPPGVFGVLLIQGSAVVRERKKCDVRKVLELGSARMLQAAGATHAHNHLQSSLDKAIAARSERATFLRDLRNIPGGRRSWSKR